MDAIRQKNVEDQKATCDALFAFAVMWSIGGPISDDKTVSYRKQFNSYMKGITKMMKFPDAQVCYDYRFQPKDKEWRSRD